MRLFDNNKLKLRVHFTVHIRPFNNLLKIKDINVTLSPIKQDRGGKISPNPFAHPL